MGLADNRKPAVRKVAAQQQGKHPRRWKYPWFDSDDARLKELWGKKPSRRVAHILQRSYEATKQRASRLGLFIHSKHRRWTIEDKGLLCEFYPYVSTSEIAEALGRSLGKTIGMAHSMGLRKLVRAHRSPTWEMAAEIAQEYRSGMTMASLAARHKSYLRMIARILRNSDCPIRSNAQLAASRRAVVEGAEHKRCTHCLIWKPCTAEFFPPRTGDKNNRLGARCRECECEVLAKKRIERPEWHERRKAYKRSWERRMRRGTWVALWRQAAAQLLSKEVADECGIDQDYGIGRKQVDL